VSRSPLVAVDGDGRPQTEKPAKPAPSNPERHRVLLGFVSLAGLMITLDSVIVTVANPTIEKTFGLTTQDLQWTVTAYSAMYGGFLLLGGRLADTFGRRRLFVIGLLGFTAASIGAGGSQAGLELIVFRAMQGLCGALVVPAALAILVSTFTESRARGRALGIWATATSLGAVTGFVIGGVLTATLGWRWIFLVNVPVGVVAISGALVVIPRRVHSGTRRNLNLAGSLSATAAVILAIYGLVDGRSFGWTSPATLASFGASALLIVGFCFAEARSPDPLVPIHLLRRHESKVLLIAFLYFADTMTLTFLISLYLQQVLGYSPLRSGLMSLPLPVCVALSANLSSRVFLRRLDPRRLAFLGLLTLASSAAWLSLWVGHAGYQVAVLPALIVWGLGSGATNLSLVLVITSNVPSRDQGIITGLFTMVGQMGGAAGVAAIVTVLAAAAGSVAGNATAAEAQGLHFAYLVAAVAGGLGALIAAVWLPRQSKGATAMPATSIPSQPTAETLPPI
jgi:EmrB/QacA subfamily drug resistance transporter